MNRPGKRPPRASTKRILGRAALAAGAFQLFRIASRARRELADYRISDARLRTGWTTIRGVAGADSLRLHVRFRDDAPAALPPIVLVPGYAVGSRYLVPLAARLVDHAHVYALDLPGHGMSDHDERPLTIPELADALAAWIDTVELRSVLLVGHSVGGQVAAEVAARRPELTAGLVLVGPTSDPAARTPAQQLARGLVTTLFDRPTYVGWAALDYDRAGIRVLREEMLQMIEHRIEDVLPHAGEPVRVVRGGMDVIVPQPWAERVARLAGAPAPTVVPGWGHAAHYDDPDEVARVVLDLARETTGSGAMHASGVPAAGTARPREGFDPSRRRG